MQGTLFRTSLLTSLAICVVFSACATVAPDDGSRLRYAEILAGYTQTQELSLQRLVAGSADSLSESARTRDVIIIVHPGYSFFFTMKKDRYRGETYRLMELQFLNEARFIEEQAARQSIVILIVPGNYEEDSAAPGAYSAYLNRAASENGSVFYVPSETSNNGTIAVEDMVILYQFLQDVNAPKVLVSGGYIGRCQKEFYNQLTAYYDKPRTFIVRELSTISPEDVSEKESSEILAGLLRQDYGPVDHFLSHKLGDEVNTLAIQPVKTQ